MASTIYWPDTVKIRFCDSLAIPQPCHNIREALYKFYIYKSLISDKKNIPSKH